MNLLDKLDELMSKLNTRSNLRASFASRVKALVGLAEKEDWDTLKTRINSILESDYGYSYGYAEYSKPRQSKGIKKTLLDILDDIDAERYDAIMGKLEKALKMAESESKRNILLNEISNEVKSKVGWYADVLAIDFDENDNATATINNEGKLWSLHVREVGGKLQFGSMTQIRPSANKRSNELVVVRQNDGRYRWITKACTAILNRVSELDTTLLFDNFVKRIESGEEMPDLDIMHEPGTDIGKADYVVRDGVVLIVTGLFDDSEFGRAIAETISNDDSGYWGTSIQYEPIHGEIMQFGGVSIPAFTDGILHKVSLLPEEAAAALFTSIK